MNKDKEPLMSAYKFMLNNKDKNTSELMKAYAKYHTEWHKKNEKWYSDEDMDKAYDKGFKDAMIKYRE